MGAKILILGGGSGGLVAANKLAKALRGTDHEITLVDRSPYHYFMPSFPWVALGYKEPEEVRRPLKNIEKKGVKFIQGEVKEILFDEQKVRVDDQELPYDYLIVSLGFLFFFLKVLGRAFDRSGKQLLGLMEETEKALTKLREERKQIEAQIARPKAQEQG